MGAFLGGLEKVLRRRGFGRGLSDVSISALAVLVHVLMVAIVLQVLFSFLDLNPIVVFENSWPLVGDAITLNSLLDFQWHLLAMIALLPAGIVWLRDRHVRVDFIHSRLSARWRAIVDLVGNLVFATPFLVLSTLAAWDFTGRAWRIDEGSASAGLEDLWLVKGMLPLGLSILGLAVALECVRLLRRAVGK